MKIFSLLALSLLNDVGAGPKKKLARRRAFARKSKVEKSDENLPNPPVIFNNCGNYTSSEGILESSHPYEPDTRCLWVITTPPGTKIKLTILNLDIEEEDSNDGPECSNNDITLPNCDPPILDPQSCEWDYLEISENQTTSKICALVDRNRKSFNAESKFLEYDYDEESAIPSSWLWGKHLNSNRVEIRFLSDDKAQFYGFKLKWETWDYKPCSFSGDCDINAYCKSDGEDDIEGECSCKDAFEGDGYFCEEILEIMEENAPENQIARFNLGGFDDDSSYSAKFIEDDYSPRLVPQKPDYEDDFPVSFDDSDYSPKAQPVFSDEDYTAKETPVVMMTEIKSPLDVQSGPGGFVRPMIESAGHLSLVTEGMMTISPPVVVTMPNLVTNNASESDSYEKGFFPGIKTLNEDGPVNYYKNLQTAFVEATERILGGRISSWKNRPFLVKKVIVRIKSTIKKTFVFVKGPCDVTLDDQTSGMLFLETTTKVQKCEKLGELKGLFAEFAGERFQKARCKGRSKKILGRINRLLNWAAKMSS